MGERDAASREAADARARLSELALELGRRVNPDHVKEQARELVADKRTEFKTRAKEKAVRTTTEWRRTATHSPRGMSTLGALVGAGVGAALARHFLVREEAYDRGDRAGPRSPREDGYRSASDLELRYGHGTRFEGEEDVRLSRGTVSGAYGGRGEVYMDRGEPYGGEGYGRMESREGDWVREREAALRGEREGGLRREEERDGLREKADALKSKASELAHSVKEKASEMAGSMKERTSEMAGAIMERTSEVAGSMKERTSEMAGSMKERTGGAVHRVREHTPSREELRGRAEHAREYAREAYDNRPMAVALGALAFGFLASQFLPVTERERRVLHPAKEKAREKAQGAIDAARSRAEEKLGQVEGVLGIKKEARSEERSDRREDWTRRSELPGGATPTFPSEWSSPMGEGGPDYSVGPSSTPSTGEGAGRIGPLPPLDDVTKRGY
jgi:gas vesicle protein